MPEKFTTEQMVRNLLTAAIKEGIVKTPGPSAYPGASPNPQARRAGELKLTADLLAHYITLAFEKGWAYAKRETDPKT